MQDIQSARRRRASWRSIPLAKWLGLLALVLMVLKAAFELAKAVLALM